MEAQDAHRQTEEDIAKRGKAIVAKLREQSTRRLRERKPQKEIRMSFDVFCDLAEYVAFTPGREGSTVLYWAAKSERVFLQDLFAIEDLFFNTLYDGVKVVVDFFAPSKTMEIR